MQVSVEQSRLAATDQQSAVPDQDADRDFRDPQPTGNPQGLPSGQGGEDAVSGDDRVTTTDASPRIHRSHGGALPQ
jgi:hypothetical protein